MQEDYRYVHMDPEEGRVRSVDQCNRLEEQEHLLQNLLCAKLMLRRILDEILALAKRALSEFRTEEEICDLDMTIPEDEERLRAFWRVQTFLQFKICELKKKILSFDTSELELERRATEMRRIELQKIGAELKRHAAEVAKPRTNKATAESAKYKANTKEVERARDATCDGVARDVSDPGADLGAGDGDPKTSATARGRDYF